MYHNGNFLPTILYQNQLHLQKCTKKLILNAIYATNY